MIADCETRPDNFRAYGSIYTTEQTSAQFWDGQASGQQDEVLDDDGLHGKLAELDNFWACNGRDTGRSEGSQFILITTLGDSSARREDPLQIQSDSLQRLIDVVGLCPKATGKFLSGRLPHMTYYVQYGEDVDRPTDIVITFRCPRISQSVTGCIRVQLSTRNCFAFVTARVAEDMRNIRSRCIKNADLIQIHPLYLLTCIFEHRYERWTDWFAELWRELVEIETATNMTNPMWKLQQPDVERLRSLTSVDILLNQLHATHLELCHSQTVMAFALKFGRACCDVLVEVEARRKDLGYSPLSMRDQTALDASFNSTITQCESMKDRLTELKDRLVGQINVSYNLIAQKDSKVNFAIAQLQAHDSRTVKGIAVLTLLFLPSTLVATLWTTNLFQIDGNANWQIYLGTSLVLTVMVLICWWLYVRVSRQRQAASWPVRDTVEWLSPPSV